MAILLMAILSHIFSVLCRFAVDIFFFALIFFSVFSFSGSFSFAANSSDHSYASSVALDSSYSLMEDSSYSLPEDSKDVWDPLEPFNRIVFKLHVFGDTVLFDPLVSLYNGIVPTPIRNGVNNVFTNLNTPFTLANDILQFEKDRAESSLLRILVNTTVGFGGIFDVASRMGIETHNEDFGQTLAVYGVPSGPYIVVPLIGGMYLRDAAGRSGESFASPWRYILDGESLFLQGTPGVSNGFVLRAFYDSQIDSLRETSIDYYASTRSVYHHLREQQIRNIASDSSSFAEGDDILDIPDLPE